MRSKRHAKVRIIGKVQGVGFRLEAQKRARSLGITGWIRNMEDGSVMIVCEGEKAKMDEFSSWYCQGPPNARVDLCEVQNEAEFEDFDDFTIAH